MTPADQAREALSPALAGRARSAVTGDRRRRPARRPHRLGAGAGPAKAPAAAASTPTSAAGSTSDTKTINDSDKSFIDSLIFWQDTPPPGVVIDPTKEQQRHRATPRRPASPPSGSTPTITRRKRGLLEGIF